MSNGEGARVESGESKGDERVPVIGRGRWRSVLAGVVRVCTWGVGVSARAGASGWARLRPAQQLALGFAAYAAIGAGLLCLPLAQKGSAPPLDHAFNAVSAISTTGLTTISVADSYTWFGQAVLVVLFQIGGIGFMTLSSLLIVARGGKLSESRQGVLRAGFALPHYFVIRHFVVHVVVFTILCESIGAGLLWWRFAAAGVENALWSAVFHSVSAFATAGFSLNNTSMEAFAGDWVVNLTIGVLCYLGGIGFIVAQDVWYSIKLRERMLTFTSKVILVTTGAVFIGGTTLLFLTEPSVAGLAIGDRLLASAFQVMTASSTAGFNTIPIGAMSTPGLVIIMIAMLIGASPSGTGGGIKTTSVSAIIANLVSVLRGRRDVVWLGRQVPTARVLYAFAASSVYLIGLCAGVLALTYSESSDFLPIVFESASAIGTVGLSMGITGGLSVVGKVTIIALMFIGRCGPLTIGLALLRPEQERRTARGDDLAV